MHERLYLAFKKFKYQIFIAKREDATKRLMIKTWLTHNKRDYFRRWKYQASRAEVVRFNKEEGPVKMETYKLRS